MRPFLLLTILLMCSSSQLANAQAAVAMPDKYSAQVAKDVLQGGGNAFDASIAAAFVLAVTYPEAGNIGGGGFLLGATAQDSFFLDYRETAPLAASRDMYLNAQGDVIPNASLTGGLASGTPGTVAGMWALHQRYGSMSWQELLEPAIHLAQQGFIVEQHLADEAIAYLQGELVKGSNFTSYFAKLVNAGTRFKQPEFARTLQRIAENGSEEFYHGETAKLLVAQMARSKGVISLQDLAEYQVAWRKPISFDWRGTQVLTAPPPSSGGIALGQILTMFDFYFGEKIPPHNSAAYVHGLAEIYKRVYADRAKYLGDPDFVDVPVRQLLDRAYLKKRASELNRADISVTDEVVAGLAESMQTTHFSVVDSQGNSVSNTYTLNLGFGSGNVVEGAGFLLNNEMDDFSSKPGVPNVFGVIGGSANAIAPRKRMLSSMTPTIVRDDDGPLVIVGTPGGSTIITSVAQTIINHLVFDMSAQASVDATRFHHQQYPINEIAMTEPLKGEARAQLEGMGYHLKEKWIGDVMVITRKGEGYDAGADPRGRGTALAWD